MPRESYLRVAYYVLVVSLLTMYNGIFVSCSSIICPTATIASIMHIREEVIMVIIVILSIHRKFFRIMPGHLYYSFLRGKCHK